LPAAGRVPLCGVADAVNLAREALDALPKDVRTHTIIVAHLEHALDTLGAALEDRKAKPGDTAARLAQIAPLAATLGDIAQALTHEMGEEVGGETLFWAEAAQRSVKSWQQDLSLTDEGLRGLR